MAKDADYRRMIHTARWRKLRSAALARNHGLCAECERHDRWTAATDVHHIRPVEEGATPAQKEMLMFSPSNLVALCHACHVRIHTEMGRGGKAANARRTSEKLAMWWEGVFGR